MSKVCFEFFVFWGFSGQKKWILFLEEGCGAPEYSMVLNSDDVLPFWSIKSASNNTESKGEINGVRIGVA